MVSNISDIFSLLDNVPWLKVLEPEAFSEGVSEARQTKLKMLLRVQEKNFIWSKRYEFGEARTPGAAARAVLLLGDTSYRSQRDGCCSVQLRALFEQSNSRYEEALSSVHDAVIQLSYGMHEVGAIIPISEQWGGHLWVGASSWCIR